MGFNLSVCKSFFNKKENAMLYFNTSAVNFPNGLFIPLVVGLVFSVYMSGCKGNEHSSEKPLKPTFKNVVVIVGDDHSYEVVGAYGNSIIRTPNIDRLAAQGAMFTNAYSNSPLCSASRQSILTGKYPHATGVNLLFTPFNDKINLTIAEHLQKNDFATAMIGKQHLNTWIWRDLYKDGLPDFGFDVMIDKPGYSDWLKNTEVKPVPQDIETFDRYTDKLPEHIARMNAQYAPQPYYDEDAKGTFLARSAIDFIEQNKNGRFFLWLAFNEPHAPFAFPIEYAGKYEPENMPLPTGSPEDDRWVPERFKGFTDEQKKRVIASYYTSVEFMDKNVGLVVDALKAKGLYDETLIIYVGDQGYLLNDHKRFEKHTMWKEAIKAPLILSGGKEFFEGKSYGQLIGFVDLVPTINAALGLRPMPPVQGQSFFPLFTSEKYVEKDYVFAEFLEDNKAMVANKKWKYIFTTGKRDLGQGFETGQGAPGITHRLYNLEQDPEESTNLAYKQAHKPLLDSMQGVMLNHFKETHPYADEVPDNLTRVGQLVWFCEPRDVGAEYGGTPLPVFYPNQSE